MIRIFKLTLPLLALALLSACSLPGSNRTTNELYTLNAKSHSASETIQVAIRVPEPSAAPELDSEAIAVKDGPNHYTHYTGAAWNSSLPLLLQNFLVDGMQQSRQFKNVSGDQEEIAADYLLLVDIQDFEVDNSVSPPNVQVRLVAKLVEAKSQKLLVALTLRKTVQAEVNHMPDIVHAFNIAMNGAVADILRGTAKALLRK